LREELRALVDDTRRDSDTIDRLEAERDRLRELVHRHQEEFVRFEDRENRLREALDEIHRIAEDDDNRDYGSRGMDALVQIAALSDKDPA
jgi:predicted  nucleic acid-binding Zn-ribbon protein